MHPHPFLDSFYYTSFANLPHPLVALLVLPVLVVLALWTVVIKGFALWHAARNGQKWWFVVMLIVNALGIPELIYLIWFRSDRRKRAGVVAPAPAPAPEASRPEA